MQYYVCAVTPRGALLGAKIARALNGRLFLKEGVQVSLDWDTSYFSSLKSFMAKAFREADAIVCIMACGIVVRTISRYLTSKQKDPGVVVVDETGRFSISLVSGHLGGANELAAIVADSIGAVPVITTATDVNGLPAFDDIARKKDLVIEDFGALKAIHMALLRGEQVIVVDEVGVLKHELTSWDQGIIQYVCGVGNFERICPNDIGHDRGNVTSFLKTDSEAQIKETMGNDLELHGKKDGVPRESLHENLVYVGIKKKDFTVKNLLRMYPRARLFIGVGCNRGTSKEEIVESIETVIGQYNLFPGSVKAICSIDKKVDENGLIEAADKLRLPIEFFSKEELSQVHVPNPSSAPLKAVGTSSVAEAAALLGAGKGGRLLVEKKKFKNVTIAVALKSFD
ncbi:Cobalamin biosynthesis protein CbiG [Dissulfuribacter thermophilus]|uniref:Cobalamin biosynthesis protein CbiG n=1 Tax=Dissulfuribacter thermophilus TaxID=1156395 RepID=A0A1B9F5E2_9BACT|nr:cobalamin biosynthesis protein [Dissulfuribacter thermophilus]OCC14981.1 Cobalamin biosynthesis protein CbiG [Dissulfuribacter thermophilus]